MNKSFLRKKFITSDPAQLKILLLLLISMSVPVFFIGSFFYAILFNILGSQPDVPGFVASSVSPLVKKANLMIALGSIPLLILLFIWGVIFSHRMAGPLKRLERKLKEMTKDGDFRARLSVRKYDYVRPLVESINRLLDKLAK